MINSAWKLKSFQVLFCASKMIVCNSFWQVSTLGQKPIILYTSKQTHKQNKKSPSTPPQEPLPNKKKPQTNKKIPNTPKNQNQQNKHQNLPQTKQKYTLIIGWCCGFFLVFYLF